VPGVGAHQLPDLQVLAKCVKRMVLNFLLLIVVVQTALRAATSVTSMLVARAGRAEMLLPSVTTCQ
jgi:hypothetical protein